MASMRFESPGDQKNIKGKNQILISKTEFGIEEGYLKYIKNYDSENNVKYDGVTKLDMENKKAINIKDYCVYQGEKVNEPIKEDKRYVLGEIIEKMRKEQDEAMRLPEKGLTLIDGVAGSGKTNIGFHRVVYLLNEFSDVFKEENIAIFCFNVSLKKYLENLRKELKIEKVNIFSIDE